MGPLEVVVLGGGTGISPCLRGLKHENARVTAVVTVADDGGSSGRLRKDYHILPPGDIRNCLVALAKADPLIARLFDYRFEDAILRGHSFGNLLLAVLTRLTGDFRRAIDEARQLLGVEDMVLPSTDTRVVLVAEHPDGTKSTGEQRISASFRTIARMELRPRPPEVSREVRQALEMADLVVLGPGSLFTSIVPNLLVPGMVEALESARGRVVLVANLMTQPGETQGLDLAAHVRALRKVGGLRRLDKVVVNSSRLPEEVTARYREAGAYPLTVPEDVREVEGVCLAAGDIAASTSDGYIRHDGPRLAAFLVRLAVPGEVHG